MGALVWEADVPAGGRRDWTVDVTVRRTSDTVFGPDPGGHLVDWGEVRVAATDRRLDLVVDHSFADLAELVLADPDSPGDPFAAAGTPWYLTLFGRDSLWAASLTLPFGTDLAAGTLRTLARRQGRTDDPSTEEQPGKILHEVRSAPIDDPVKTHLPPLYYGTVDATPLWVRLLHDAWRWGLADDVVHELRPHLDAALGWVRRAATDSPDGFLRYVDSTGTGLANQGWKDSGDAMRRRDGTIAPPPIALVETQAYAVAAVNGAADLWEEVFGEDGAELRAWAADLADRVRRRFWVEDADGPYLAMALDHDGTPVDGVGSNMGHVLGTGTLNAEESALVAARLTGPDLLGPYGVGTLGRANPAYNPIGYHTGSVWTHDTAIAALGLVRDGHAGEGAGVVAGPGGRRDALRVPLPRAVRRRPRVRAAGPLPGLLPTPGLVGRLGRGTGHRGPRPGRGRARRAAVGEPDAAGAVRRPAGPRAARARRARGGRRGRRRSRQRRPRPRLAGGRRVVIEVPEGLARSPRFWDDEAGRAWLERLPRFAAEVCERWELRVDGEPRHGSHALVLPVTSADGPVALRLTPPCQRATDDLRAVRFWAGPPMVRVLRADEDGAATLLERLDPDRPLSRRSTDEIAEVLGGLVPQLSVAPAPVDVPSTEDEARSIVEGGRRRWHQTGRQVPAEVLGTAVGLADELMTGAPGLAVDGDLHADQVLPDPTGAWRVVDPVLMRGDPAYDLARIVWMTLDRLPDEDAILRFTDRLVGATGLDRSRAEAWLIVRTVGYWLWCLEAGLTEDPVRCARFVAAFADD